MRSFLERALRTGLAVLAGLVALGLLAAAGGPGGGQTAEALTTIQGATDSQAGHARQSISRRDKRRIRRAYRLYSSGHKRKARRVMRKVRDRRRIPLRRLNQTHPLRAAVAGRRAGCGWASGTASWEVTFIGADVFKATLSQRYCWKRGRITDFNRPQVTGDITGFGELINFSYEGVVGGQSSWERWNGEKHGQRNTAKAVKFHACTPVPTGCIFGVDHIKGVALALLGNGTYGFGDSD
jgi:hypothetical protein